MSDSAKVGVEPKTDFRWSAWALIGSAAGSFLLSVGRRLWKSQTFNVERRLSRSEFAMRNKYLDLVEQPHLKAQPPQFQVGDTVDVHTKIVEGDKERIQVFSGTVIMKKGAGINETFTVRRIVNNEGVERIYPIHSPFIAKVVVKRSGETRRAKLYYLRDRVGKATRLVESRKVKKDDTASSSAAPAARNETEQPQLVGAAG